MDELERVKQVLEMHCGEGNEISAGIIGSMLGYSHDDTHAKARRIVKKCAEKYGIPLGANTRGYFIMTSIDELREYEKNLQSRIQGIEERKKIMEKHFKEWNK